MDAPRGKSEQRLVEQAKIILLAHEGRTTSRLPMF